MRYYQVEKSFFISKMKNESRLEVMERLELFGFGLDKIHFYWNNSNKNEYEFYSLLFDYLVSKSKKDELFKIQFERFLEYFKF